MGEKDIFWGALCFEFYLGMLLAFFDKKNDDKCHYGLKMITVTMVLCFFIYHNVLIGDAKDAHLFNGISKAMFLNEYEILKMVYAILVFFFLRLLHLSTFFSRLHLGRILEILGKYSMAIYLYHWIINDWLNGLCVRFHIDNTKIWFLFVVLNTMLPVLVYKIFERIKIKYEGN